MEKISTKTHWRDYWKSPHHQPLVHHEEMLKHLLSVVDVRGKEVLEVGAGMGGDSIFLAKLGAKITALDFTAEALTKISKNAEAAQVNVKTVQADAHHLPFPNDTFDVVFHQGFLEHFTDPLKLIIEQKRVLKSGGILVIDVPQRYTTYTLKKHWQMWGGQWFAGWEREFSIGELERLLRQAGLKLLCSYGWGYYGKLYTIRHLKLGAWYERMWQRIEKGRLKLYLCWCVGVIAQKL